MSGILWLASYPKSGNTWLRVFVTNLQRNDDEPTDINDLRITGASSRLLFDEAAGVEASDLTDEEIERYRPRVYQFLAESAAGTVFLKIHDAYTILPDGNPLIPAEATAGAIYIVRNPLDVAISFAHHSAISLDRAIAIMASKDFSYYMDVPIRNLNQRLLSWSEHVLSWIDRAPFPVRLIKYEDMHERPIETFTGIARFCGLPCDSFTVERALRHSSFEQMQMQEHKRGFIERSAVASLFFREGKTQVWKEVLSESQVALIVEEHGAVMRRLGYSAL
ncbi:MAG: sulfotransferase domain-containing protein [Bryobacteraceae bacterium]